jgi:hypothetical protein
MVRAVGRLSSCWRGFTQRRPIGVACSIGWVISTILRTRRLLAFSIPDISAILLAEFPHDDDADSTSRAFQLVAQSTFADWMRL